VNKETIEKNDFSLTAGRYVGVAPVEEDENFDFETRMGEIKLELAGLNEEASELANQIQANLNELGL
jgi:type I restriction enzyme M protein